MLLRYETVFARRKSFPHRVGKSGFNYDPTTGQLIGAGYQVAPDVAAAREGLMGLAGTGIGQAQAAQAQQAGITQAGQGLFNLGAKYIAQTPQEQAYIQDRPLNLVNALRSGAQVQSPTFQGYAQQGQTQGANYLGAAQSQYQAGMDATNAANAETSGMMSGLFGIGMGLAGMPGAGGSIMQGAKGLFR